MENFKFLSKIINLTKYNTKNHPVILREKIIKKDVHKEEFIDTFQDT